MDKIQMIDCFFCGSPKSCRFVNGKGYVVLGQSKNGKDFGAHPMCEKCRHPKTTTTIKVPKELSNFFEKMWEEEIGGDTK